MGVRVSVFVRGLGVLVIALGAVAAVTLTSNHHAASSPGAVSSPAAVSATPRAAGTATPAATATRPRYVARIVGPTSFLDKTTETSATVDEAHIDSTQSGGLPAPQQLDLLFRIRLHNGGRAAAHYSAGNFHLLAGSGDTYGTAATVSRQPALRMGTLNPGGTTSGWIGFTLPAAPATVTLLWNDDNRLLVPGSFAQTLVRRNHNG